MLTAKWRMRQLVVAPSDQRSLASWFNDVSTALIDYTNAVGCWIKQDARVQSAAETVRLAFTIHNDGSIGYLQVVTNDAVLQREQLALVSARQKGTRPDNALKQAAWRIMINLHIQGRWRLSGERCSCRNC